MAINRAYEYLQKISDASVFVIAGKIQLMRCVFSPALIGEEVRSLVDARLAKCYSGSDI